jgi:hypothetical protein
MSVRTREPIAQLSRELMARPRGTAARAIDRPGVQAGVAFGLYLLVSLLFFGIPILRDIRHSYVGLGRPGLGTGFTDPSVYMWSLQWWPHAFAQGMNPLFTHLVWAPQGVHLAWTTTVPGAAILAWPITATLGPVAAFNVWILLAPALAAWTAYLLCRHVTGAFWPSVVGGYLFGFSSYELAQMTAHLNLALIFPVPLAVLLVLLRLEGRLKPIPFVLLFAGTVALQFSFSTEIAFTMTLFGGLVGALALAIYPEARERERLIRTAGWTWLSYGVAVVLLAPLVLALPDSSGFVPTTWHSKYATDVLNLVTPTRTALLRPPGTGDIAHRFAAGLSEEGGYLGLLVLVVVAFAVREGRTRTGRLLLAALGLIVLASLGPELRVGGIEQAPLPWALTADIPLVRMALSARFMVHAWLVLGLLAALWLAIPSQRTWGRWGKWAVAGLCVVALLPNLALPLWNARTDTPPFFSTDLHRRYLESGRNTLVIPFANNGFSMLWQAQADMSFPMVGGYISPCRVSPEYRRWAIVASFLAKRRIPGYDVQLQAFLGHLEVANIVVDPKAEGPWRRVFGTLPVRPLKVGGILYYRVPDQLLLQYRHLNPPNITRKALQRLCQ